MWTRRKEPPLPATGSSPKPGDFPVGSPESRAAARMKLEAQDEPVLMVEISRVGSKGQFGPWKKHPGGVWMRRQLGSAKESEI